MNANFTLDDVHRNATLSAEQLELWKVNGSGFLGLPPTNQFNWLRTNSSVFSSLNTTDPSAGPTSANFELIISVSTLLPLIRFSRLIVRKQDNFASKRVALPATGRFLSIVSNLISPTSRTAVDISLDNSQD